MKINFRIIFIILILIVLGMVFYFSYNFYQGIKPAFLQPPEDISKNVPPENGEKEQKPESLKFLNVPDGFSISIFAKDLTAPRVIAIDKNNALYTSITKQGSVIKLKDNNNDNFSEENIEVLSGLKNPHGLAFYPAPFADCASAQESFVRERCGVYQDYLYVAEEDKIKRYKYDTLNSEIIDKKGEKIIDLPSGGRHFTRTIAFSELDKKPVLYVSVGSTCDVCFEKDERSGTVMIMDPDGKNGKIFSKGLRNAVFIIPSPETGKIAATEMGRDFLGDNLPPDEINILNSEGQNFGWPICYGNKVHDTNFDKNQYFRDPCEDTTPAFIEIPAHSAPLGLAFMDNSWGEEYENDLFVAYHGSWNKTIPTGYKIVRFDNINGQISKIGENFITGWLIPQGALGRPVDIKIGLDKAMYISDDKAGVIYRMIKE